MFKHSACTLSTPDDTVKKKKSRLEEDGSALANFKKWCEQEGMLISPKVGITDECSHRYGMVALKPIKKSEVLFEIPRSMLLWERNHSLGSLPELETLDSESGWVKLLLVLMLEYTNPSSKWAPYMRFSPPPKVMDTPIYWSSEARKKILADTPLLELVEKDIHNIETEYYEIALPFIKKNAQLGFDEEKHTFELYKQMAGFIMAYSFTETCDDSDDESPPKMVPMADVLNHVSKHNAHLQFDQESLKMVATMDIEAQSEVFNTYGYLSNSQLLQMYGFVEGGLSNAYDSVEIPIEYFKKYSDLATAEKKWKYLFGQDDAILKDCVVITIGCDGILSSEEAKIILKILAMTEVEFDCQKEEEWESDSSASSTSSGDSYVVHVMSHKKISLLPPNRKLILKLAGSELREKLIRILKEKEDMTFSEEQKQNMFRKSKIITILLSQISILDSLMRACVE